MAFILSIPNNTNSRANGMVADKNILPDSNGTSHGTGSDTLPDTLNLRSIVLERHGLRVGLQPCHQIVCRVHRCNSGRVTLRSG